MQSVDNGDQWIGWLHWIALRLESIGYSEREGEKIVANVHSKWVPVT